MGQIWVVWETKKALVDILRERAEEDGLPLRVILKETLQVYVLAAIYAQPTSDRVTFQGDTCLRLVYGGPRYSEDLDFVTTLTPSELQELFGRVHPEVMRLAPFFEGEIFLRVQKATAEIVRWKVYYRGDHSQDATSVSVEFAPYPAYTTRITPLRLPSSLPALPLVVVRAETEAEILADKVVAFAGRRYVKGRDVFDIWWLRQRGIEVDRDMVRRKLEDYGVHPERFRDNLARLSPDRVRQELERFLSLRYRTQILQPDVLSAMVEEVRAWLEGVMA